MYWKRPWCWERLKAGEGDNGGWDVWMASPTWWTWVWVNSGSWWWTVKPGMLSSMRWQRVKLDWVAELNWNVLINKCCSCYTVKNKPKPVFYSMISFKNCLFMCECVWHAHKSCIKGYMHVCMLSCFSRIWFFVTPWTIYSPPGSSVHGVPQTRILEWAAIPSSKRSSGPRNKTCFSHGSCIAGEFFTAEPLGKPGRIYTYILKGVTPKW